MSLIIYMLALYFGAIAFRSVHSNTCSFDAKVYEPLRTPFYFTFMGNEEMQVTFTLNNVPRHIVNATIYLGAGDWFSEAAILPKDNNSTYASCYKLERTSAKTVLNLYTVNGLCATQVLVYGKHVETVSLRKGDKRFMNILSCLSNVIACAIVVDLRNACKDQKKNTRTTEIPPLAPDTEERATRNVSHTELATTNDTSGPFPVHDTSNSSRNNTNSKNFTLVNSDVSNAKQDMSRSAQTDIEKGISARSIFVITSCVLGLVGAVLCAVGVLGVWSSCRRRTRPTPANMPAGPFYVNFLFREECAREIEQIEQHQYEEIPPQRH